ncbi:helix-turn-helix domain-containing protein [Clostridium botulinum]|uniref:helix-turn-helix domain-containing protein n=1 Tax=Clostridium botulinum TaxID=1491 RepID=UPI003DA50D06
MEISEKLKDLRTFKNLSTYDLAERAGIPQSTISKLENGNRKIDTDILQKIADAMDVPIDIFFQKQSPSEILGKKVTYEKLKEWDDKYTNVVEESKPPYVPNSSLKGAIRTKLIEDKQFKDAEEAMKFILEQPSVMGYGGFDTSKMSDQDIIDFANELLNIIKMLGPKYNK